MNHGTRAAVFGDISNAGDNLDLLTQQQPTVAALTEKILSWSQEHFGLPEIVRAKQEFYTVSGPFSADDSCYHQLISYFLDYFTYQRPIGTPGPAGDRTPYEKFMQSPQAKELKAEVYKDFQQLLNFEHGLYQIKKITKTRMNLKSLLRDTKIEIVQQDNYLLQAFSPGSILQGFVFHLDGNTQLTQGLIIHPKQASQIILKRIRQYKKSEENKPLAILSSLAKQNLKLNRHKNLDSRKVYAEI